MANKTIKQLSTEFTSLAADDWHLVQRDSDSVTGKAKSSVLFGGGWNPLSAAPTTITHNGNRSYDLVFNSLNLTGLVSPGTRLKLTRSSTAPTQCADLESSSSQYFNDTTVSGMTFTDDFVVSGWIKLESYTAGGIVTRYNGTSGWQFWVNASGQIGLQGFNAAGTNWRRVFSYQSVPLGKWVHVSAQLDMSTYTLSTTTCYTMMDGVDVPSYLETNGSNPTSLIQAGNLEIGSWNGGSNFFDGKIAQVAIYSAKVTQATIKASMNQTLTGSETSLVSAYTLSNSLTDLSANANNLTAQGGALATSSDTPFTNSVTGTSVTAGTTDYAIVMAQSFSTNTTLTVQVPEGETLPTTGGTSAAAYSTQRSPYGFPNQKGKWRLESLYLVDLSVSIPSSSTWYSGTYNLTLPVGDWSLRWDGTLTWSSNVSVGPTWLGTLAAATPTSFSDRELQSQYTFGGFNASFIGVPAVKAADKSLAAQTTYTMYVNSSTSSGTMLIALQGASTSFRITAENAYL